MKKREQMYAREAATLLRDITMYRVLTEEQLMRLHSAASEKERDRLRRLLAYLVQQGRVWLREGCYCAAQDALEHMDRGLRAAVWVLADVIDRVEYHSAGDYPAKLVFFAEGEVFEIIHAAHGMEALLASVLRRVEKPSRYLVLVDDVAQIEELDLPHVSAWCTVSPDGAVAYYGKLEEA